MIRSVVCFFTLRARVLLTLGLAVMMSACWPEPEATLARVRATPGCFSPDSIYKVVRASLSPEGEHIPFIAGGEQVLRRITQGKDSLWAIVPDSLPTGRPITRRFRIRTNALLGLVLDAPVVLIFVTDSARGSR
jgi:hypothetical protein